MAIDACMDSGRWVCWGKLWSCGKWHQLAWCSPPSCWDLCLKSNSELHLSPWLCRRKRQCFSSYFEVYSSQSQGKLHYKYKNYMTVSEEIYWDGFGCHQLHKKGRSQGNAATMAMIKEGPVSQQPFMISWYKCTSGSFPGQLETLLCDSPVLQGTRSTTTGQIQSTVLA